MLDTNMIVHIKLTKISIIYWIQHCKKILCLIRYIFTTYARFHLTWTTLTSAKSSVSLSSELVNFVHVIRVKLSLSIFNNVKLLPWPDRPETEVRDMTRYIYAKDIAKGVTVRPNSSLVVATKIKTFL